LNNKFHALFDPTSTDDEEDAFVDESEDFSGDVAPGSLESPQTLPKASEEDSFFDKLCAMFHRAESSLRCVGLRASGTGSDHMEGSDDDRVQYKCCFVFYLMP
jgi:hypothetical protein